jgi:hypothetical protein
VLPVALEGSGDVADVLAYEHDQPAEVVIIHRGASAGEAIAAEPVVVHALLPVRRGLAVEAARIGVMRPLDERGVQLVVPWRRSFGAVADAHLVLLPTCACRRSLPRAGEARGIDANVRRRPK